MKTGSIALFVVMKMGLKSPPRARGPWRERLNWFIISFMRVWGPFGFAQGRLFDSAEPSLREVSAALKMTIGNGDFGDLRLLRGPQ